MSWNYRIVKYKDDDGFGLHEVHYDDDGNPSSMTERAVGFVGESPKEIKELLMRARLDSIRNEVFEEPDDWE